MTTNDNADANKTEASSDDMGIVYVLTNPAMQDLVKIGMTTRDDITKRLSELYTTGVPLPFECEYAVTVKDVSRVERALHLAFGRSRLNPNREFFEIEVERVKAILDLLKVDDVTPTVQKDADSGVDAPDKLASDNYKKRRPALILGELGIPDDEEIEFIGSEATAKVFRGEFNRVIYQGEEHSISGLTAILLGRTDWVAPHRHWTYNGRVLQDIYNELHGF